MDADMEALADELAPTARVGLADLLSTWTLPDYEARERQQWLRMVIAALGIERPGKPARFAQVNVPARFVAGIAGALEMKGFIIRTGKSLTEEYRSLTVWQAQALTEELAAEDARELVTAVDAVEEAGEQGRVNEQGSTQQQHRA